jgi:hypothetical protein
MAAAYDRVCQFLPKSVAGNYEMHQRCASKIIGLVDHGQRDPALLFELSLNELIDQNTPHRLSRNYLA